MRIRDDCFKVEDKYRICLELEQLLATPSDKQARPCPGCRFTFDGDKSIISTSHCSASCPFTAKQMSSDPGKFPVEENVVPLVYAFYTMRLMMPCWSCEGHINGEGLIVKIPRVWFYATSHFYPKMVAQLMGQLHGNHKLVNPWDVRILPFSQGMFTTTYSLEPCVNTVKLLDLSSMQADMKVIASNLRIEMLRMARSYLKRANRNFSMN